MGDPSALRDRFAALHESGIFMMPNAWDIGSALVLQSLGFESIATTSSGFAASLGRHDQRVSLAELSVHVADITSAIDIPLSVDAEGGHARDVEDLPRTVGALAAAGASGVSIEDYLPGPGVLGLEEATERVGRFVEAAEEEGLTVTARAENHLYETGDLDDTIARLQAYAATGAHVLYAPGLTRHGDVERVVAATSRPVNVLLLPGGPAVAELDALGVRRVSTGGALTFAAYGALAAAGRELLELGTSDYAEGALSWSDREAAFGPGGSAPA